MVAAFTEFWLPLDARSSLSGAHPLPHDTHAIFNRLCIHVGWNRDGAMRPFCLYLGSAQGSFVNRVSDLQHVTFPAIDGKTKDLSGAGAERDPYAEDQAVAQ